MLFETNRLLIREWLIDDLEQLHKLYADPAISENIGPALTREETQHIFENQVSKYNLQELEGRYVVLDNQANIFLGTFLMRPLANDAQVEVGYAIRKSEWDKGLATELLSNAIPFIFSHTTFKSIYAFTGVENNRSKRVLDKCGFTEADRFFEGEEEMCTFFKEKKSIANEAIDSEMHA